MRISSARIASFIGDSDQGTMAVPPLPEKITISSSLASDRPIETAESVFERIDRGIK